MSSEIESILQQLHLPQPDSHKGQNGKLLIIGGSELFHAASKWSLDVASKFVDMVFYSSVPSNNELIQAAKQEFWNGIVIGRDQIDSYLAEADCILIGPGLERTEETETLTNQLLEKYPTKKWVVDAGALQMVNPRLLNQHCLVTPHLQEFTTLYRKTVMQYTTKQADGSLHGQFEGESWETPPNWGDGSLWFEDAIIKSVTEYDQLGQPGFIRQEDLRGYLLHFSKMLKGATVILKGQQDFVFGFGESYETGPLQVVEGGHPGMTKGGTGDVLAGLAAALYCTNQVFPTAVTASYINKKAGEALSEKVGPFFNASDLVDQIPATLWQELQRRR